MLWEQVSVEKYDISSLKCNGKTFEIDFKSCFQKHPEGNLN